MIEHRRSQLLFDSLCSLRRATEPDAEGFAHGLDSHETIEFLTEICNAIRPHQNAFEEPLRELINGFCESMLHPEMDDFRSVA